MKRVLVTGGTGFIGREALPFLLESGYEVHVTARSEVPDGLKSGRLGAVHYHCCDLLREGCDSLVAEIQPTHLLHLAWYAKHGAFWWSLENLDWVAASLRLSRAFAAQGGYRAVFAGSCAEYDWSFETLDEALTPLNPATLYGVAKASLYRLVTCAAERLAISAAWGRIFFPYGPRDQPGRLLSTVIDKVSAGEAVACSAGRQSRAFIYVEDVARAFVELLDSQVEDAVNIATDQVYTIRDVVAGAARLCGDGSLVQFGAKPSQPNEPEVMRASVRRLYDEVGFRPRFDLISGLRSTVELRRAANGLRPAPNAPNLDLVDETIDDRA
jgi:nucleoside-diphosphate-sugar epimerase